MMPLTMVKRIRSKKLAEKKKPEDFWRNLDLCQAEL